jgi:hypothetical protein
MSEGFGFVLKDGVKYLGYLMMNGRMMTVPEGGREESQNHN